MFAVDDSSAEVCSIGLPSGRVKVESSPVETKIGGYAAWHDSATAPLREQIACKRCYKSENMVLVMQIFAPVEFDRSLYVYCCNSRTCSLTNDGWLVIRNQQRFVKGGGDKRNISMKTGSNNVNLRHSETKHSSDRSATAFSQDLRLEKANTSNAGGSVWANLGEEGAVGDAELEDMLNLRDLTLQTSPCNPGLIPPIQAIADTGNVTNRDDENNPCIAVTDKCLLTSWSISNVEEYWTEEEECVAREGVSASLIGVRTNTFIQGSAASGTLADDTHRAEDDAHIDALLKSYYEGEEDLEIVDMVKKASERSSSASDVKKVLDMQGNSTQMRPDGTGTKSAKQKPISHTGKEPIPHRLPSDDAVSAEDLKFEDSLSRSSLRQQTELYFQNRIAHYPTQVLRYAYGGEPLWITYPDPLTLMRQQAKQHQLISSSSPPAKEPQTQQKQEPPTHNDDSVSIDTVSVVQAALPVRSNEPSRSDNSDGFERFQSKKKRHNKANTNKSNKSKNKSIPPVARVTPSANPQSAPPRPPKSSSSNSSSGSSRSCSGGIPCCELCGSDRVFECQLMPALLSNIIDSTSGDEGKYERLLAAEVASPGCAAETASIASGSMIAKVPPPPPPPPPPPEEPVTELATAAARTQALASKTQASDQSEIPIKGAINTPLTTSSSTHSNSAPMDRPSSQAIALFQAQLGSGLDFGVVAIWSCPNSCTITAADNRTFATEFAVVQSPPDIA